MEGASCVSSILRLQSAYNSDREPIPRPTAKKTTGSLLEEKISGEVNACAWAVDSQTSNCRVGFVEVDDEENDEVPR